VAEGLLSGVLGAEEEEKAASARVGPEGFSAALAFNLANQSPVVAAKTVAFLCQQTTVLHVQEKNNVSLSSVVLPGCRALLRHFPRSLISRPHSADGQAFYSLHFRVLEGFRVFYVVENHVERVMAPEYFVTYDKRRDTEDALLDRPLRLGSKFQLDSRLIQRVLRISHIELLGKIRYNGRIRDVATVQEYGIENRLDRTARAAGRDN
jgi:hypothetical protein